MRKSILAVITVVMLLVCTSGLVFASTTALAPNVNPLVPERPIRIMELGDSITAGIAGKGVSGPPAGYRMHLVQLLQTGDYDFAMVGSRTDFSGTLDRPQHEGWPGYVLRSFPSAPAGELYGKVIHGAIRAYHPDIVLLMAGTNDLLRYRKGDAGYTLPNIVHSMDLVLNQILTLDPKAIVIVAGVVSSPKVPACAVAAFDDGVGPCAVSDGSVASLVKRYQARGYRIVIAQGMDQAVPRNARFFPDGIHPSGLDGYDRIAEVWFKSLTALLPAPPKAVSQWAKAAHQ